VTWEGEAHLRQRLANLLAPGEELLLVAYGIEAPKGLAAAAQLGARLLDAFAGSPIVDEGRVLALTPTRLVLVRASRRKPFAQMAVQFELSGSTSVALDGSSRFELFHESRAPEVTWVELSVDGQRHPLLLWQTNGLPDNGRIGAEIVRRLLESNAGH
jgi:hypothetical protein